MAISAKQLLDLPDEILGLIAEAVDDITSLRALARTCTRFQDHAERSIYRSVVIEHGAQARGLYKAVSRRPRRATMALKLTVAPSTVATRGTEHLPAMLEKMTRVKDLFIESPFCNQPACSEFVEDQERYAQIFCQSSLRATDPSKRFLSHLVSCTLNFTGYHSRICPVDAELSAIFLHPTLQSLTISCARIDIAELEDLRAFAQKTPLNTLHLDQCDMSAAGLATILSLPTSLTALEVLEVSRQGPPRYSLDYSQALLRALGLQRTSLEYLCLSLRDPKRSPFSQDFDMSAFHALRLLRISCQRHNDSTYPTSLKWVTYAPPALDTLVFSEIELKNRQHNATFPSELEACLKTLDPADLCHLAKTVNLSLKSTSDVRGDARNAVEELGKHFQAASSHTSQPSSSAVGCQEDKARGGPRLYVTRFKRGRPALPPYLYREYQPEHIPVYDSSSTGTGWLNATGWGSGSPHFLCTSSPFNLDFSGLDHAEPLQDFDFDNFLNSADPPDMHSVFGDPFYHDQLMGDAPPTWPAAADPVGYDVTFETYQTHSHYHTHEEDASDSVD